MQVHPSRGTQPFPPVLYQPSGPLIEVPTHRCPAPPDPITASKAASPSRSHPPISALRPLERHGLILTPCAWSSTASSHPGLATAPPPPSRTLTRIPPLQGRPGPLGLSASLDHLVMLPPSGHSGRTSSTSSQLYGPRKPQQMPSPLSMEGPVPLLWLQRASLQHSSR